MAARHACFLLNFSLERRISKFFHNGHRTTRLNFIHLFLHFLRIPQSSCPFRSGAQSKTVLRADRVGTDLFPRCGSPLPSAPCSYDASSGHGGGISATPRLRRSVIAIPTNLIPNTRCQQGLHVPECIAAAARLLLSLCGAEPAGTCSSAPPAGVSGGISSGAVQGSFRQ